MSDRPRNHSDAVFIMLGGDFTGNRAGLSVPLAQSVGRYPACVGPLDPPIQPSLSK